MTLTPTITLTAMVNAATATEVRLKDRVIERAASLPKTPKSAVETGSSNRISRISAAGVNMAPPTMMHSEAAKLSASPPGATSRSKPSEIHHDGANGNRGQQAPRLRCFIRAAHQARWRTARRVPGRDGGGKQARR